MAQPVYKLLRPGWAFKNIWNLASAQCVWARDPCFQGAVPNFENLQYLGISSLFPKVESNPFPLESCFSALLHKQILMAHLVVVYSIEHSLTVFNLNSVFSKEE